MSTIARNLGPHVLKELNLPEKKRKWSKENQEPFNGFKGMWMSLLQHLDRQVNPFLVID